MEFKVYDPDEETSLEETVKEALKQIEEKKYEQTLLDKGIEKERIRKYGFAFEGKKVLIGWLPESFGRTEKGYFYKCRKIAIL